MTLRAATAIVAMAALAAVLPSVSPARANAPGTTAIPILDCADVNGNGAVEAGDITKVVLKFGTTAGMASYHLLYDVGSPVGSVAAPDIAAVVSDFGKTNASGQCPRVDTEVAQAALWVIEDHPGLLTLNDALLTSLGYTRGSLDVPGQGVHYTSAANWDATFEPAAPEGLVYIDGNEGSPLAAQLYYVDGDVVGWGPNPDPEHTNIDPFCEPVPAESACSWDGPGDTWHFHINLCTLHIGTPRATNTFTSTAEQCEALNGGDGGWAWRARVGWMGHAWVHYANPNGRFADCFPDGGVWKAFNCPQ